MKVLSELMFSQFQLVQMSLTNWDGWLPVKISSLPLQIGHFLLFCLSWPLSRPFCVLLSPSSPLCPLSVHPLSLSLSLIYFLFTYPPVFCSVSLFISFPFKLFFLWIWRTHSLRGGKTTNFGSFFGGGALHNHGAKNKTWRRSFNLWNPNWNELN